MPQPTLTEPDPLTELLRTHRSDIAVEAGRFTGPGDNVLSAAMSRARFVILGEDHGTAEIPRVARALYETLQPAGYDTLVVEVGPYVAAELRAMLGATDPGARMRAYLGANPFSLAVYNWREELDFLQRASSMSGSRFRLIGIDQEILGAAKILLEKARARSSTDDARRHICALLAKEQEHYRHALQTGTPQDLFMLAAPRDDITAARDVLRRAGQGAESPLDALLESRTIYYEHFGSSAYRAGARRARLMKRNFTAALGLAARKVMVKIGAFHGYKGVSPLQTREVGAFLAELAEGDGARSLHVLALGVRGARSEFAGIGKPLQSAAFDLREPDSPLPGLRPLLDIAVDRASWSLFDLRPLRGAHGAQKLDPELERVIVGYDLVLLIPYVTAATEIQ